MQHFCIFQNIFKKQDAIFVYATCRVSVAAIAFLTTCISDPIALGSFPRAQIFADEYSSSIPRRTCGCIRGGCLLAMML